MKTTIRFCLGLGFSLTAGWLRGEEARERGGAARPNTYGVEQVSYYRIAASEFTLLETAGGLVYSDGLEGPAQQAQRYSVGAGLTFIASPHLPSGALLTYFELDSCDEDPVSDVNANLYLCDDLGNCGDPIQRLSSADNAIACGYTSADVSAAGVQVDNYRNQITVLVFTESGTVATRFAGVILGYELRVSPPPQFADFTDVPTNHPFFQFIEALYASGITSGCGNGNFCPDAPLTRGQMAAFLAKALGLQWQ
jgi:S-layer family protein